MTRLGVTDLDRFDDGPITLRLVRPDDCTERYLGWLLDPQVNRYLETRWSPQTLDSIRSFVHGARASDDNLLFAIVDRSDGEHVGNIKLGPINPHHGFADVSYFIGDRSRWGRGLATAAIRAITRVAFERLKLHRVQAGLYADNVGSGRALERVGFRLEGRFRQQLMTDGNYVDHLWYGLLREEFQGT